MSSIFFHPDYTVGFGITPNPAAARLADYTADREFHPCPEDRYFIVCLTRYSLAGELSRGGERKEKN